MKKVLFFLLMVCSAQIFAQAPVNLGPTEQKINDAICDCMTKQDMSTIKTKEAATQLFTDCVSQHTDLIMKIADERKIDITNDEAMNKLGLEIGKNLMKQNCAAALQLGIKMAGDEKKDGIVSSNTEGIIKRMDNKGFNYIVITENNSEKSFIWLRQFPGSEKFMNGIAGSIGKKVNIKWQEIEVYLPLAKGYYKVKEITAINFL